MTTTPAHIVLRRFGGPRAVAAIVGLSVSRVYRWTRPRDCGGTDGLIPAKHQPVLLAAARARGIRLTPADLVPRRSAGHRGRAPSAPAGLERTA